MMNPKHLDLLSAARLGNFKEFHDKINEKGEEILDETTRQGNTALHMAARFGHIDLVQLILERNQSLAFKSNHKGETAVHMAASAGRLNIVKFFMDSEHYRGTHIGRIRDKFGNTPLHGSVWNEQFKVMDMLAKADKEALLAINDAGESPLSIAIGRRNTDLAARIIDLYPSTLDYIGHDDQTPLHCAVQRNTLDIINRILTKKPELIKVKDARRRTPLHYAAALGHQKMVELLVKEDPDVAYEGDENSQIPLHLAAENGHVSLIKALLEPCWDTFEMVDNKQQNILHLAAKNGNVKAVKYFLTRKYEIGDLLNFPDEDGNTPLHLAANNYHSNVVSVLSNQSSVEIRAINNDKMTPLGIIKLPDNRGMDLPKHLTLKALKSAYAQKSINLEDVPAENKNIQSEDDLKVDQMPNKDGERSREMARIISVMSPLIATFTFTAAFTLPGGFISDGPDKGLATLIGKTAFQAFVISDTFAMTSSLAAAVIVFWSSSRRDTESFLDTLPFAIALTWISLIAMALAFVTGLFVVLQKKLWLAILVCAIGCGAPFILYIIVPLCLPLFEKLFKSRTSLTNRQNIVEDNPFMFIIRLMKIIFGMLCDRLFKCLQTRCKSLCCCQICQRCSVPNV